MSVTCHDCQVLIGYCYLLQVDVAEDQLLVAAVDDGGPVAAGEHVAHGAGAELAEDGGLSPEDHLLLVRQVARPVHDKVK